jgi:hypothetical protein
MTGSGLIPAGRLIARTAIAHTLSQREYFDPIMDTSMTATDALKKSREAVIVRLRF